MHKAYKLLSIQEKISHKKAKELIDKRLVFIDSKPLKIARTPLKFNTIFEVKTIQKPRILFQDEKILAVDKPALFESHKLCEHFEGYTLLHRLDYQTSGVILLVRPNSLFYNKAKREFLKKRVYKEYRAWVSGFITQPQTIESKIKTIKKGFAKSIISKDGLNAHTYIEPIKILGKKTLLKILITTGRTHQIRVHLQHIGHSILGDEFYGGIQHPKLMLHAHRIKIFDYDIKSDLPEEFQGL